MSKTRAQIILVMLAIGIIGLIAGEYLTLPSWATTLSVVALCLGIGGLLGK